MESWWNYKGGGKRSWEFHCIEFRQAGLGGKLQLPDTSVFLGYRAAKFAA
jgi:hypothetical protein